MINHYQPLSCIIQTITFLHVWHNGTSGGVSSTSDHNEVGCHVISAGQQIQYALGVSVAHHEFASHWKKCNLNQQI